MAQIAQQDNLIVTSTKPIATIDEAAKKKLTLEATNKRKKISF